MIYNFCEFGGENLLGKAREIADSIGDRVRAIVASNSSIDIQRLGFLGADEVMRCDTSEPSDWIEFFSSVIANEDGLKLIIFPSNVISNAILGAVYASVENLVSVYCDDVEFLDSNRSTKSLVGKGYAFQKFIGDKVNLVSIKASSVAPPFEDSSRYGKPKVSEWAKDAGFKRILFNIPSKIESGKLTILLGPDTCAAITEISEMLGRKYDARVLNFSGAIEIVYGPCLAIGIKANARDLPKFDGYLISINSKKAPIAAIADTAVLSDDIVTVLSSM